MKQICVVGVVLLTGCPDDGLVKLNPRIVAEPEAVDFGDGFIGEENITTLLLKNEGNGNLVISGWSINPDSFFDARNIPEGILGLSEKPVDLVFVPLVPHETYEATLILSSDDPERPRLEVPLKGVGGVQEIEVMPEEVDFGLVNEGTEARRSIEIRNIGKDKLVISDITWTSTSVDLRLDMTGFLSGTILPGTSTSVTLFYSPVDLGHDAGQVDIHSNDEDEPVTTVPVRGSANLAPRAIAWGCNKLPTQVGCDGVDQYRMLTAGYRKLVGFDGRESFDPEGSSIGSYRWELTRPPESGAVLFFTREDIEQRLRATGDVEIDRVGTYDLRLIVQDERGLMSLDLPESHVSIQPRDLEVILRWDVDTDVDLHFVRPNGTVGDFGSGGVGTSTGTDCSTFNRRPNWGDGNTSTDDPSLDRDDVSGRGPEIISLDLPEAGLYTVFVHYCDSRVIGVNASATLEVHVRGALVQTLPISAGMLMQSHDLWQAATLSWDASTTTAQVVELSEPLTARPDLCFIN